LSLFIFVASFVVSFVDNDRDTDGSRLAAPTHHFAPRNPERPVAGRAEAGSIA
jgi:hypothetical protein